MNTLKAVISVAIGYVLAGFPAMFLPESIAVPVIIFFWFVFSFIAYFFVDAIFDWFMGKK